MPRNVEIKAPVDDLAALQARVAALADRGPEAIAQDDTFFLCRDGRLKLRVFADGRGELIAYQRNDGGHDGGGHDDSGREDSGPDAIRRNGSGRNDSGRNDSERDDTKRDDSGAPSLSDYLITPVAAPDALRATLARALGVAGRVIKQRTLYLIGLTRVHLDRVAGLGDSVELEVVLRDDEDAAAGVLEAKQLIGRLRIDPSRLIAQAYVDLLNR